MAACWNCTSITRACEKETVLLSHRQGATKTGDKIAESLGGSGFSGYAKNFQFEKEMAFRAELLALPRKLKHLFFARTRTNCPTRQKRVIHRQSDFDRSAQPNKPIVPTFALHIRHRLSGLVPRYQERARATLELRRRCLSQ